MGVTMENVHPDSELHKDWRQLFDWGRKQLLWPDDDDDDGDGDDDDDMVIIII